MFNNVDIKVLHIEPTTVCNAACPQCSREDPNYYVDSEHRAELSLNQVKSIVNDDFIRTLDKMFMCGNFGDPAAAQDCLKIFEYFRSVNPKIVLGLNTNGSLRSTAWWKKLAGILQQSQDYVVFSIDGLADTNHIYRKNTNWKKIIANAQAFIDAGGNAHWDMLVFEHNEHQVAAAEALAKELGFKWFRAKVTKRFKIYPVNFLNPPKSFALPNIDHFETIECYAKKDNHIYLSATGKILPCCWFGNEIFALDSYAKQLLSDWSNLERSWNTRPHRICSSTCGVQNNTTSFTNQWKIDRPLNV